MKPANHSINRIYGDPQILALNNRIQFIKSRHTNMRIPFTPSKCPTHFQTQTQHKTDQSDHCVLDLLPTAEAAEKKAIPRSQSEKLTQLKELKSQRYKQAKQNSQRYKLKISRRKQRQLTMKRIKRSQIQKGEQQCRTALQTYEHNKIKQIKQTKTNRQYAQDRLHLKRIELKRQLVEEQTRSLHVYEKALCYKSQLMLRIKQLLQETN